MVLSYYPAQLGRLGQYGVHNVIVFCCPTRWRALPNPLPAHPQYGPFHRPQATFRKTNAPLFHIIGRSYLIVRVTFPLPEQQDSVKDSSVRWQTIHHSHPNIHRERLTICPVCDGPNAARDTPDASRTWRSLAQPLTALA